jgi:hypothetical protein
MPRAVSAFMWTNDARGHRQTVVNLVGLLRVSGDRMGHSLALKGDRMGHSLREVSECGFSFTLSDRGTHSLAPETEGGIRWRPRPDEAFAPPQGPATEPTEHRRASLKEFVGGPR